MLVITAVNILHTLVYAQLSHNTYFSLGDLNKAICSCVDVHNDTLRQRKEIARRRLFQEEEKIRLRSSPHQEPYCLREYKMLQIQKKTISFFSLDSHHYSVPCQFIGLEVKLSYTDKEISIYYAGERAATHRHIEQNLKNAHFRHKACMAEIDDVHSRGLGRNQIARFSDCAFIRNAESILVVEPTGVGKSYIASSLGEQE